NAGQTVPFNIERGGQEVSLPVTLRSSWPSGAGPLGVQLHGQALETRPVSYPLPEALAKGWERAWQLVSLTLSIPVLLIQGTVAAGDVRPIGIVGMTQAAGQAASAVGETGGFFPPLARTARLSRGLCLARL